MSRTITLLPVSVSLIFVSYDTHAHATDSQLQILKALIFFNKGKCIPFALLDPCTFENINEFLCQTWLSQKSITLLVFYKQRESLK